MVIFANTESFTYNWIESKITTQGKAKTRTLFVSAILNTHNTIRKKFLKTTNDLPRTSSYKKKTTYPFCGPGSSIEINR